MRKETNEEINERKEDLQEIILTTLVQEKNCGVEELM